jgi:hypothetical protein
MTMAGAEEELAIGTVLGQGLEIALDAAAHDIAAGLEQAFDRQVGGAPGELARTGVAGVEVLEEMGFELVPLDKVDGHVVKVHLPLRERRAAGGRDRGDLGGMGWGGALLLGGGRRCRVSFGRLGGEGKTPGYPAQVRDAECSVGLEVGFEIGHVQRCCGFLGQRSRLWLRSRPRLRGRWHGIWNC